MAKREEQSLINARDITIIRESLREIETQFRKVGEAQNLRADRDRMLLQLLWTRVYKEQLPDIHYFPEQGRKE